MLEDIRRRSKSVQEHDHRFPIPSKRDQIPGILLVTGRSGVFLDVRPRLPVILELDGRGFPLHLERAHFLVPAALFQRASVSLVDRIRGELFPQHRDRVTLFGPEGRLVAAALEFQPQFLETGLVNSFPQLLQIHRGIHASTLEIIRRDIDSTAGLNARILRLAPFRIILPGDLRSPGALIVAQLLATSWNHHLARSLCRLALSIAPLAICTQVLPTVPQSRSTELLVDDLQQGLLQARLLIRLELDRFYAVYTRIDTIQLLQSDFRAADRSSQIEVQ